MKVLIIRMSSIGDIILTTPVLKELKKKHKEMIIDFIVLDKFKDSISGNPNINQLIIFEKDKYKGYTGIKKFVETIKHNNYDFVIDLHSKTRSKLITKFIGAKYYRYKKRKWWKSLLVKVKIIKYSADDTIVKNYFGAVKNFGVSYRGEDLEFNFEKKDLEKVNQYNNYVVFAPGASKETKKWTKKHFANLAKLIYNDLKKKIILIGGKSEIEELDEINRLSGNICVNLSGGLTLKQSGALLSKADFVVTNDSGPFHIARGVKTLSFVIFGPTDPKMFDYDENSILLYANEKCSPCSLHGDKECPKKHFRCMENIDPKYVYGIIQNKIKQTRS